MSARPTNSFHEQKNTSNLLRIREISSDMPAWFLDFLRSTENRLSSLTRLYYCYDLRLFLEYLIAENKDFSGLKLYELSPEKLAGLTVRDFEIYLDYLGFYIKLLDKSSEFSGQTSEGDKNIAEIARQNAERGKARKLASLRTIFKYLYKNQLISSNPTGLLTSVKIHEKAIIRLSGEEANQLIETVRSGEGLSERQKKYQRKTMLRDIAMLTLFLTTGIRISELVGLNVRDVNLKSRSFIVTRKGGNQSILYFGEETRRALTDYIEERKGKGDFSDTSPLFLSLQNKRITARAVENLVEKYARVAVPLKKITPHKLRSTYGTLLYENTGDIYLVADVLGHKDVNTTRRHYAAMSEEHRKLAAGVVKFGTQPTSAENAGKLKKREDREDED